MSHSTALAARDATATDAPAVSYGPPPGHYRPPVLTRRQCLWINCGSHEQRRLLGDARMILDETPEQRDRLTELIAHRVCRDLDPALWEFLPPGARDVLTGISRPVLDRAEAVESEQRHARRSGLERPADGTWWGHLAWLASVTGDREFTAARVLALADRDGKWTTPPGTWDLTAPDCAMDLGKAYATVAGQVIDGWLSIEPGGMTHSRRRWRVLITGE